MVVDVQNYERILHVSIHGHQLKKTLQSARSRSLASVQRVTVKSVNRQSKAKECPRRLLTYVHVYLW